MDTDILILGGGAAGSAAAITLLQQDPDVRVTLTEPSDFTAPRVGETIPPDANLLLRELGVEQTFRAAGHLPCHGSHSLWGSDQIGHNDFLVNPHGHGWHLDRAAFDAMLLGAAERAGARVLRSMAKDIVVRDNKIASVTVDGTPITARHYIDATGRNAILLRALGVTRDEGERLSVLWTRFQTVDDSLSHSTWLESGPHGWWYAAQLPGNVAIVALGTDPAIAKDRRATTLPGLLLALTETQMIAPRLTTAKVIHDSFQITTARAYLSTRVAGENWIAVGDAASAFDPLSSAGIYKALLTGQLAARAILSGDPSPYTARVAEDYHAYQAMLDHLYSSETRWSDYPFWAARKVVKS